MFFLDIRKTSPNHGGLLCLMTSVADTVVEMCNKSPYETNGPCQVSSRCAPKYDSVLVKHRPPEVLSSNATILFLVICRPNQISSYTGDPSIIDTCICCEPSKRNVHTCLVRQCALSHFQDYLFQTSHLFNFLFNLCLPVY